MSDGGETPALQVIVLVSPVQLFALSASPGLASRGNPPCLACCERPALYVGNGHFSELSV